MKTWIIRISFATVAAILLLNITACRNSGSSDRKSLDIITSYLFPKFMVNYEAGRKDSALAVALKIASLIDSAVVKQKDDNAAELATIYDETQKKDHQIPICLCQADYRDDDQSRRSAP